MLEVGEMLSVVCSVGSLLRYQSICGGAFAGSSGEYAGRSVLQSYLGPVVFGDDVEASSSPCFSSISLQRLDAIF